MNNKRSNEIALNSLCATAMFLLVAMPVAADDWFRWRGPDLNGISRETDWLDRWPENGPPIAWKSSVGVGFSSVVVSKERLYTIGNADNVEAVYCIDATTGRKVWKHTYQCPIGDNFFEGGPTSTPTVDGKRVYTLSRQGDLFCFDAANGTIQWSTNVHETTGVRIPGWGFSSSPLVHGKLLLLNVGEAGTAVDKSTGKVVWSSADSDAGYATPIPFSLQGRTCAILATGKFCLAVEIESGKELWRHRWLTRFGCNAADPIVDGERVWISSGYNRGCALLDMKSEQPNVVWKNKDLQNQLSSSVLIDGHVYGVDGDMSEETKLTCMELETGNVAWTAEGISAGALTAANGKLIVLTRDGELLIGKATSSGFEPTARAQVLSGKCWTVPVLANGRIYCRNVEGDLVCVNVRTGTK